MGKFMEFVRRIRSALVWCGCVVWIIPTLVQTSVGSDTATQPLVVYLHTEYLPYSPQEADVLPYRLGREIMRQAVLIAARDELGCVTRDETLLETAPTQVHTLHLLATERAHMTGQWQLMLKRMEQGSTVWEKTYDFLPHGGKIYADIIPKIETDTRSALVEALRAAGVTGAKPTGKKPTAPGPEVEQLLNTVDIVAQFGAIRVAHTAIAQHGESPEWLGVLVRGYANLSMLTTHYWYSAPEVFTARAWLYAQRMVAAEPQSELALWHRAYAWALGGTLQHAQADLAELERRRTAAGSAAATPPSWTKLIAVYLNADREGLDRVGKEQVANRAWALMLKFQLAASYMEAHLMNDTAREIDKICPTAYGTYGYLVTRGQHLSLSRFGAGWGPMRFAEHVPQSLAKLTDLPSTVRLLVAKSPPSRRQVDSLESEEEEPESFSSLPMDAAERLRGDAASSGSEPSWSALSSMLEEEQFLLVVQYFADAHNATERDFSGVTAQLLPLVKRHRYAALIESERYDRNRDFATLVKLYGAINVTDPRLNMMPLFARFWGISGASGEELGWTTLARAQRNFTIQGMMEYVVRFATFRDTGTVEMRNMLVDELREVAPTWDCTYMYALYWVQTPTMEQLRQWENSVKTSPVAWTRLAFQYDTLGDLDSAKRCAQRALAVAPLSDPMLLLADIHEREGHWDKCEQTLVAFLETPDLGLSHGPALSALVNGLTSRGQWRKAKQYAVQFGETYAALGLSAAAFVTEGLAEWEESEQWVRAFSTSYPSGDGAAWYLWCRRTGRGDVDAAKPLAEQWVAGNRLSNRESAIMAGVYHEVSGDPAAALEAYQAALAFRPSFNCSIKVARLARQTGGERLRTETINAAQKAPLENSEEVSPEERKVIAAGQAILQLMKTGDASPERLGKIEQLLLEVDSGGRAIYACELGMELDALGKKAEAEKYWRRCLVTPEADWGSTTLAGFALAKRHGTSRPDDDALDATDLWVPLAPATEQPAAKQ